MTTTSVPSGQVLSISLTVNNEPISIEVEPRDTLASVLRTKLGLTGTHLGCEHGVCGACTVAIDGSPARSCLTLAVQVDGREVLTIEGLAEAAGDEAVEFDGQMLHPIQKAFADKLGFQCAFCAPGFLITTLALLQDNPAPTREETREEISGNLCRCTGYHSILDSIEHAVTIRRTGQTDTGATDA